MSAGTAGRRTRAAEFTKGIMRENPVLVLLLGLCPTLAVSTSVSNAIGMGLAASFVLVCSNAIISLIRSRIPGRIRIPCFIVVIATFVVMVEQVMGAYSPLLAKRLGIFIPLIVVNCIILGRAEAFASKSGFVRSVLDGAGMGLGFTVALVVISVVREVLGSGRLAGELLSRSYVPMAVVALPPGAFFTIGLLLAALNLRKQRGGQSSRS